MITNVNCQQIGAERDSDFQGPNSTRFLSPLFSRFAEFSGSCCAYLLGGQGETRTLMSLRSYDFESYASTNSATRPFYLRCALAPSNGGLLVEFIPRPRDHPGRYKHLLTCSALHAKRDSAGFYHIPRICLLLQNKSRSNLLPLSILM